MQKGIGMGSHVYALYIPIRLIPTLSFCGFWYCLPYIPLACLI